MAKMQHSGGLVEAVLELGFDMVKYFEGAIGSTPQSIANISPPARRLTLRNTDEDNPVYLNVTGDDAAASASFAPGDNIKIGAGCTFSMDFDFLTNISLVTAGPNVMVEGTLGWKGTQVDC